MNPIKYLFAAGLLFFAVHINAQKTASKKVTQKVTSTSAEHTTTESSLTHLRVWVLLKL